MTNDTTPTETASPETTSRRLIRACDRAVLSTALVGSGWPYGSLVMAACDHAARPLLLISDLAEHTKNLGADARASLLFDGTVGMDSPLTGARVTVTGRLTPSEDPALIARYTARHPDSEMFLGFADFHLYEMTVDRAHIVAGFGVIHWIDAADLLFDTTGFEDLTLAEADVVEHMNADHADAVALYATKLLGLPAGDWKMTGVDPEGIDLRCGGEIARLDFEKPVKDAESARSILVRMVKAARA
jgi:heme iron utilization protein